MHYISHLFVTSTNWYNDTDTTYLIDTNVCVCDRQKEGAGKRKREREGKRDEVTGH